MIWTIKVQFDFLHGIKFKFHKKNSSNHKYWRGAAFFKVRKLKINSFFPWCSENCFRKSTFSILQELIRERFFSDVRENYFLWKRLKEALKALETFVAKRVRKCFIETLQILITVNRTFTFQSRLMKNWLQKNCKNFTFQRNLKHYQWKKWKYKINWWSDL